MREVDKIVEERKEELEKLDNIIIKGAQLRDIDGKRYSRTVNLQIFLKDNGEVELMRVL